MSCSSSEPEAEPCHSRSKINLMFLSTINQCYCKYLVTNGRKLCSILSEIFLVVWSVVSGPPVQVWRVLRVCRRTVPPLLLLSSPHTCNLCQSLGIAQTRPTGTTTTYIVIVFSCNLLFHINLICPLLCQALSSSGREASGKL